jgi:hypothetical protein
MKHITLTSFLIAVLLVTGCNSIKELADKAGSITKDTPLTQGEAADGIREALIKGITNGTGIVSKVDGYFKNDIIKILFPEDAKKVEDALRKLGLGSQVDKAVLSMNRGAEQAAKDALPIFVNAIKKLTFKDALAIVSGDKNACTEYLKRTTTADLTAAFKPVITKSLDNVSATRYWSDIMRTYNKIPLVDPVSTDLPAYVTDKAISGLFTMIANEELAIRTDPAARTTEILKRVFK